MSSSDAIILTTLTKRWFAVEAGRVSVEYVVCLLGAESAEAGDLLFDSRAAGR